MKAAVCRRYGGPDAVQVVELPAPSPRPGEVLVRVCASTVNSADARIRGSRFPPGMQLPARLALGIMRPRKSILGTELSGVVEALGSGVSRFRPGDEVVAFTGGGFGCHAELRTVRADAAIIAKPANLSFEQAAALSFGGTTALYFLRDIAKLRPGERVLVNGASGSVGTAAVQLARHFGARVTGVSSAGRHDLLRLLGAHDTIDYRADDFTRTGDRWDVILETVGNASLARCRSALNANGRLLLIAGGLKDLLKAPIQSRTSGLRVAGGPAPERQKDLADLKEICEAGAYRPVVSKVFPLEQIALAHAEADSNRKVGNVVVTMGNRR